MAANGRPTARSDSEHGGLFADRTRIGFTEESAPPPAAVDYTGETCNKQHPTSGLTSRGGNWRLTGESDAQLVAKSLQGNEKAFRTLVETHQPMVYAAVRGVLGGRADVVQDVFIKVYRALARFRSDAKLSSWIYRIAKNEAIDAYRRTRRTETSIEDMELAAPAGARPDERFRAQEHRQHLDIYMKRLDEKYRMVLELRYMGEKSYAEIGEIMELPAGTVKSYIHRAKAEMKRMMTEPGAEEGIQTP